jgi:hypothetical protein
LDVDPQLISSGLDYGQRRRNASILKGLMVLSIKMEGRSLYPRVDRGGILSEFDVVLICLGEACGYVNLDLGGYLHRERENWQVFNLLVQVYS